MTEFLNNLWQHGASRLNTAIFTLGDTPVTTIGLFRVMLILSIAWGISRQSQNMLKRVSAQWKDVGSKCPYRNGICICTVFRDSMMTKRASD